MARSPIFDARARGAIIGLSLTHSRGDILRAILEGTAFEVRHNLEVMAEAGAPARRLFAVGGGVRSGVWSAIVTHVTGHPQVVPALTIGASYGDALLAARGTGIVPAETSGTRPPRCWSRTRRSRTRTRSATSSSGRCTATPSRRRMRSRAARRRLRPGSPAG